MDKNKLLGFLFLAVAFWLMTQMPKPENRYATEPGASSSTGGVSATTGVSPTGVQNIPSTPAAAHVPASNLQEPAKLYKLEVPGQYEATFSSNGGAIQQVRFLGEANRFRKYDPVLLEKLEPEETASLLEQLNKAAVTNDVDNTRKLEKQARKRKIPLQWVAAAKNNPADTFDAHALLDAHNDYILNEGLKRPVLELEFHGVDGSLPYQMTSQTEKAITFQARHGDLVITRRYAMVPGTFQIQHTTTLQNVGQQKTDLGPQILYGLGASLPTVSDTRHEFQNVGYYAGQRGWTGRRKPARGKSSDQCSIKELQSAVAAVVAHELVARSRRRGMRYRGTIPITYPAAGPRK